MWRMSHASGIPKYLQVSHTSEPHATLMKKCVRVTAAIEGHLQWFSRFQQSAKPIAKSGGAVAQRIVAQHKGAWFGGAG